MLQSTLLPRLEVLGARVDLVFLLVVLWATLRELDEATLWGLLGGALVDLLSAAPFGTSVLSLGLIAVAANTFGSALRRTNGLLLLAFVPLATIVYTLLHAFVLESVEWPVDWPATVALVVLPGAGLNTLATPFAYWFLRVADGWFQPRTWLS